MQKLGFGPKVLGNPNPKAIYLPFEIFSTLNATVNVKMMHFRVPL